MKKNLHSILVLLCICVMGCNKNSDSKKEDLSTVDTTGSDRDTANLVSKHHKIDTAMVTEIRRVLPVLLSKELVGADTSARKFTYDLVDLNGDGKNEIFVGFTGMNWCGSGGCTALILSSEWKLVTRFTVVDVPFIVLSKKTKGWKDLVIHSGGADRLLEWNGESYPANPSVAPKYKHKLSTDPLEALAFTTRYYRWFTF